VRLRERLAGAGILVSKSRVGQVLRQLWLKRKKGLSMRPDVTPKRTLSSAKSCLPPFRDPAGEADFLGRKRSQHNHDANVEACAERRTNWVSDPTKLFSSVFPGLRIGSGSTPLARNQTARAETYERSNPNLSAWWYLVAFARQKAREAARKVQHHAVQRLAGC
jgi:hypothetical protein